MLCCYRVSYLLVEIALIVHRVDTLACTEPNSHRLDEALNCIVVILLTTSLFLSLFLC